MSLDSSKVGRYLAEVFGAAMGQGHRLTLWTLPHKSSHRYSDVESAKTGAMKLAETCDVYAMMGMSKNPPTSPDERGSLSVVTAIPGFWADIDIADPSAHKRSNLCPSIEEAERLVGQVGIRPSIVVYSGHGLHAYWLFSEPMEFESDAERERATLLSQRWNATIKSWAKQRGWHVDSVHDLTRVLRVPGTLNRKTDPPKFVEMNVVGRTPPRYTIDDLEARMVAEEYAAGGRVVLSDVGPFTLDSKAEPPADKLAALVENDNRFRATWEKKRPDLIDQSPSSYDMALANYAVQAGWSDQEIVNLLISHRRKHGADLKLRVDYYQRTIARVRSTRQSSAALDELASGAVSRPAGTDPRTVTDTERDKILATLSEAIGVKVSAWVKNGKANAIYTLVLEDGEQIRIGSAANVLNQSTFRTRVYDATGAMLQDVGKEKWNRICATLATIAVVIDNPERTDRGKIIGWLCDYLPVQVSYKDAEWTKAIESNSPFLRDGRWHVAAPSLIRWLRSEYGVNFTTEDVYDGLRLLGFECGPVSARVGGVVRTRSYWSIDAKAMDLIQERGHDRGKSPDGGRP